MTDPTLVWAFYAGLMSFLSPCVLPLVPGYLSYMSGMSVSDDDKLHRTARSAFVAATFVLGFTFVFVALGATATYLGSFLRDHQERFQQISGVLVVILGFVFMGVLRVPWLYREARFHPTPRAGAWGSVVLGASFAFGWTPCIGATLGATLAMAAGSPGAEGGVTKGMLLLAVYSLGLGLPFIVAGLGISRLSTALGWLRKHTRKINLASGILLVAVGVLLATGQLFQVSIWIQQNMNVEFWRQI
jgi:cytochrome c-type biogenesis protein